MFLKKYEATQLFSTLVLIYWASNQYIMIFSEGSCDTECWSNDAENLDLASLEQNTF